MSKKHRLILPVIDSRNMASIKHFAIVVFRQELETVKSLIMHEEDLMRYEELLTKIDRYAFAMMTNSYSEKFLREEIGDFKRQIAMQSFRSWN